MAKKIALLIGVSEYPLSDLTSLPAAAKDIEAMQRVLLNPRLGGFLRADTLINYSTQEIRSAIEECFEEREPGDLILLYYSGHGIKDEDGKLFFAAHDTKVQNRKLRKASASADYDIYEAMNQSRAKQQIIILDCCFSGAFDPNRIPKSDITTTEINLRSLDASGRVVLSSSSSTEYSFGDPSQDLSIYTRFLVEGIESGEADQDRDGVIRIRELHEYAQGKVQEAEPRMKPRINIVKDEAYNIIVASRCSESLIEADDSQKLHPREWNTISLSHPTGSLLSQAQVPLQSFLEPFEDFITELIERLSDHQWISQLFDYQQLHSLEVINPILSVIRAASKADTVFVLQQQKLEDASFQHWSVVSYSDTDVEASQASYFEVLKSKVLPAVSYQALSSAYHHGIILSQEDQQFIVIPIRSWLTTTSLPQMMVVCQPRLEPSLLGNIYGQTLSSFYQACHSVLPKAFPLEVAIALIEAAILDGLKNAFGFVSANLYDRRYRLFCDRLQQMIVHFEPILQLDDLDIFGWEALARDPLPRKAELLVAPVDLFKSAELWGTRFTTELDLHFLWTATESYRLQCREAKLNRPSDIRRLSVNVYPDTLMRTAYREMLRKIIKVDKLITGRKLTLEISEKAALPKSQSSDPYEPHWTMFRHEIERYVHDFDIQFAIDDFGVGYASVSRLVGLNPTYVKIDREILLTKSQAIINLVASFVRELLIKSGNSNSFVIVEGIESHSQIDLRSLRDMKVSHIQGYLVGKAKAEIQARLEQKEYEEFLKRLG